MKIKKLDFVLKENRQSSTVFARVILENGSYLFISLFSTDKDISVISNEVPEEEFLNTEKLKEYLRINRHKYFKEDGE